MKLVLPVVKKNGEFFSTSQELVELINEENSGTFVVGKNSNWHGGIHVSERIADWCADEYPLRAIHDGKIIAYRLREESEVMEFNSQQVKFSNCFCLIEHEFKAKKESDPFVFYSLYMHMLPWKEHDHKSFKLVRSSRKVRLEAPKCSENGKFWYPAGASNLILPAGETFELLDPESLTTTVPNENVAFGATSKTSTKIYRFVRVRITSKGKENYMLSSKLGDLVWIALGESKNNYFDTSWYSVSSELPDLTFKLKKNLNVRTVAPTVHEDGTCWYPAGTRKVALPRGETFKLLDSKSLTATEANENVFFGATARNGTIYRFAQVQITSNGVEGNGVSALEGKNVWIALGKSKLTSFDAKNLSPIRSKPPQWMIETVKGKSSKILQGYGEDGSEGLEIPAGEEISYKVADIETPADNRAPGRRVVVSVGGTRQYIHPEDGITITEMTPALGFKKLAKPIPIKVKDPVCYLGRCDILDKHGYVHRKKQVHFEVFSVDEPPEEFFKYFNPELLESGEASEEGITEDTTASPEVAPEIAETGNEERAVPSADTSRPLATAPTPEEASVSPSPTGAEEVEERDSSSSEQKEEEPSGVVPQNSNASEANGTFLVKDTLDVFKDILGESCDFPQLTSASDFHNKINQLEVWINNFSTNSTEPLGASEGSYEVIASDLRNYFKAHPRSHCLKHLSEWTEDDAKTVTFLNNEIKPRLENLKTSIEEMMATLPPQLEPQRPQVEGIKKVIEKTLDRFEYEKERVKKFSWTDVAGLGNVFWYMFPIPDPKWENIIDVDKFMGELNRLLGLPANEVRDSRLTRLGNEQLRKNNLRKVIHEMNGYYKNKKFVPYIADLAYMFATMLQETPEFLPVKEKDSNNYSLSGQTYHQYMYGLDSVDSDRSGKAFTNGQKQGDWKRYHGHGLVQVTWRNNYEKIYRHLEEHKLATHDELFPAPARRPNQQLMLELKYAVYVMIWGMTVGVFSTKSLKDYLSKTPVTLNDYKKARKIINGQDNATQIAKNAVFFEKVLKKSSIAK